MDGASPVPVQMWDGASPVPVQMWDGASPVLRHHSACPTRLAGTAQDSSESDQRLSAFRWSPSRSRSFFSQSHSRSGADAHCAALRGDHIGLCPVGFVGPRVHFHGCGCDALPCRATAGAAALWWQVPVVGSRAAQRRRVECVREGVQKPESGCQQQRLLLCESNRGKGRGELRLHGFGAQSARRGLLRLLL